MEAAMASFWCPVALKLLPQQAFLQPTFGKRTSVPSRSRCVRAGGFVRGDGKLGRGRLVISNGIRAVESFDAAFQLVPESEQLLHSMLTSESFIKQVARDCSLSEGTTAEFIGELFQPVPWSETTKHGMLQEYEKYYNDKENYVIVNIPPQVMFQAKIFKPSRLCAIFKKKAAT